MKKLLIAAILVGVITAGAILYLSADIAGEIDHTA
jgi:hypothetical protein